MQEGILGMDLRDAVLKLRDAGYLYRLSRCPTCNRGHLGDMFLYGKGKTLLGRQRVLRDCRARFNVLNFNTCLPQMLGRSMRADQLYGAIRMDTDTAVNRRASEQTPKIPSQRFLTLGCSEFGF